MTAPVPWWASDDPWAFSPDEAAALEAKRREHAAEAAATPDTPPF